MSTEAPTKRLARLTLDDFATVNRRHLLHSLAAGAIAGGVAPLFGRSAWAQPAFAAYPFALGVASGDPLADGFVIWTKIAPAPLERRGGMPNRPVEVRWEVASNPQMRSTVQKGSAVAHPEVGHAVHVEIGGLDAARDYFYRFTIGDERSMVGRARTLPAPGAATEQVRFASAGCHRYEDGYFTAWRRIAEETFDFVYFYGDYIYEYRVLRPGNRPQPVVRVMPGEPDECFTLDDYRQRYAIYKLDADLQAAHASTPFVMTFDDHEIANNWASEHSPSNPPPELFLLRRAAAFQAWYEHAPVRRSLLPRGPDIHAYRRFDVGNLLTMNVLDTRQYRSVQPCGDGTRANCAEALEPGRTMLGAAQERWLFDGFKAPAARWNVLAQQVMMMRNDRDADPAVVATDMDKWDGTVAARDRLFAAIEESKLGNVVVLTGDIHQNWAGELKANFDDERSKTLGVELVATSISSAGDGFDINDRFRALVAQQPYVKLFNSQRGYLRHTVTPEAWRTDCQVLDRVTTRGGVASTRRRLVVEHGKPGFAEA